jgi:hypothetical protein
MSDLLAELEEAQKLSEENADRADGLTPLSQKAFADAGDVKRATRDVPEDIGELEDQLEGRSVFHDVHLTCSNSCNRTYTGCFISPV